jgi:oxygen-independent coproporphyrinogen-3 oxidase
MCTLVSKYNVAGPRYTSYPTVPYWDQDKFSLKNWKKAVKQSFDEGNSAKDVKMQLPNEC